MVRQQDILDLIKGGEVPHITLSEIDSLVESYPYSHLIRLARVAYLKKIGDINTEPITSQSAVHVPNRGVLHKLYSIEASQTALQSDPKVVMVSDEETDEVKASDSLLEDSNEVVDIDPEKKVLEQQFIQEAVQSSIALEVDPSLYNDDVEGKDKRDEVIESTESSTPRSFLEFISGDSDISRENEGLLIDNFLKNSFRKEEKGAV
ncbi:MAG: hypothetical protein HKN45_07350 [Flavobacteriales bacterium]|nr:hypothetical protein [Flavobacteriales bacterium]